MGSTLAKRPSGKELLAASTRSFPSRFLIVDSKFTEYDEGRQSVDLILASREESVKLAKRLGARASSGTVSEDIRAQIRSRSPAYLGCPNSSILHRSHHVFPGMGFQWASGSVLTEKQAFDFGYVEPYLHTVCGRIAQFAEFFASRSVHYQDDALTQTLREAGIIERDHFAVFGNGARGEMSHLPYDPVFMERAARPKQVGLLSDGRLHLAQLIFFERTNDGQFIAGSNCYIPNTRSICTFMVEVPSLVSDRRESITSLPASSRDTSSAPP